MYSNDRSSVKPPLAGTFSELRSSGHDAEPQLAPAEMGRNSRSAATTAMLRTRTKVLLSLMERGRLGRSGRASSPDHRSVAGRGRPATAGRMPALLAEN